MDEIKLLLLTLKQRLKQQGLTYRDLAVQLGLSEPTVKRIFSTRRVTLDRLVQMANLAGCSLAELSDEAILGGQRLHTLKRAQERVLVSDEKLLLVAVCALNQWTVQDIVRVYRLDEAECIGLLLKLERQRLIRLLPGNRIRLNVARDFDWLPGGPIRHYFLEHGLADFIGSSFAGADESLAFMHGMLTDAAIAALQVEIRKLRQRFVELHEESLAAPLPKRCGGGLLLAWREWELAAFTAMRRTEPAAAPAGPMAMAPLQADRQALDTAME